MKVKIKMNVPKPPTGIAGIMFFGSCYKWKDVFYRMGEEYTVKKADFNPAIMVSLEPRKKPEPPKKKSEKPIEEYLKRGPPIIHKVAPEHEEAKESTKERKHRKK